jgi:hypothetical protein
MYMNFCPETTYDRFGWFAADLYEYSDDIDRDAAYAKLGREGTRGEDWRWRWDIIHPRHYTECSLYSLLLHPPTIEEGTLTTLRAKLLSDRTKLVEQRSLPAEHSVLEVIANDLQAKGQGRSGAFVEARHARRVQTLQDVLAQRLRLEREEPIRNEDVAAWYDAVVADIREIVGRSRTHVIDGAESDWTLALGSELPAALRAKFEDDIQRIEAEYMLDARSFASAECTLRKWRRPRQ